MIQALSTALALLTRLPIPRGAGASPQTQGRSVAMYPVVGLLIGAILWLGAWLLSLLSAPPLLAAAMLVSVWVAITGALHLDGLADSADACLGAHGDRERALEIMKDPRCGPAAVVALVLVLVLKVAALTALLAGDAPHWWLVIPPVLGRGACAALFLCLGYVRRDGLAARAAEYLHRPLTVGVLLFAVPVVCLPAGLPGAVAAAAGLLVLALAVRHMKRQLGGFTGDTAGAAVETVEAACLAALALTLAALAAP